LAGFFKAFAHFAERKLMPIPALSPEAETSNQPSYARPTLRIVGAASAAARGAASFYPRALAYFVDLCVVAGFSMPIAKAASAVVVAVHLRAADLGEKASASAFSRGFNYANSYLLGASFAALAAVYFVGLPLVFGRTFGMGIFGLRIECESGGVPSPRQLVARMGGCALNFASGGLFCLGGLREREGRFLQDKISQTVVVKGD
jgi:hypothetical protein